MLDITHVTRVGTRGEETSARPFTVANCMNLGAKEMREVQSRVGILAKA